MRNVLELFDESGYLVVEMTPVNSLDSTALHILEDLVMDFRVRQKYTAFCSTSSRVDKMMRKSGMREKVGDEWFHNRVHDAVTLYFQLHGYS